MARLNVIDCDSCGTRIRDESEAATVVVEMVGHIYNGDYCMACAKGIKLKNFKHTMKPWHKPRYLREVA